MVMKQTPVIPLFKFQNNALPFKAQTLQHFTADQDNINETPHFHDYYEMIWLIRGRGTLQVDLQEHTIGSNTVFCLKPDQTHQFQTQEKSEGFVFSFSDSFFSMDACDLNWKCKARLYELFADCRTIRIDCNMEEDLKEIAVKLVKEFETRDAYKMELLMPYFKIFLLYLTRALNENLQPTEHSRETELVKNFTALLDKNYKEKKMVAAYAAQLLVTPNYLNRIIKNSTGSSAGHHIRQRIVLEAKRMGRYTAAGMKEIAYQLGFIDSAHFSKFFKTYAGINFSEFKKSGGIVIPFGLFNRA
jgi:AraC family transcriptional activator of pobA